MRPSFFDSFSVPSRADSPRPVRRRAGVALLAAAGASVLFDAGPGSAEGATVNTADAVIGYYAGNDNPDSLFEQPEAALGELNGDTGYGGLNPFNPPFSASDIVVLGPGGYLTLHTAVPFRTAGLNLGVFVNNGLVDVSDDGSGVAGDPPSFFSATPKAQVSVSDDNVTWEYLNDGEVIDFDKPTNVYLDEPIVNYYQELGAVKADMSKPWTGELSDLAGDTYDQIRAEFDRAAGGNWLNLDGLTLGEAEYVRFEAPDDARMVLDAIATTEAVPEPSVTLALLGAAFLVMRRRRRA